LTAALRRLLAAGTALAAVLTVVSGLSAAPTASAAGSLVEGTVTHVDDGDTLHVKVPGVAQELYIRMTGINAPELTTYANDPSGWVGMCGGVAAARRLHGLVYGKRVQVSAMDNASNSGGRPRRAIAVQIDGAWTDVGGIMVSEGLALYLPSPTEYQYNRDYLRRAQIAAAQGVGLYGRSICGAGPSADANLSVVVQWDAPGDDNANVNGEHIKVVNHGATPVSLGGWWVRDSAERGTKAHPGYRFPAGTSVPPHASVVVRVGKGTSTATTKYWGLASPIFENVTAGPRYMSDGGYLFDPDGDLRAWQLYPCNEFCPVPELKGKVAVTKIVADPAGVDTAAKEYVVLRNVSPQTISLVGYQLRAGAQRWTFRTGSTLRPREQVTVYMGKGRTTRLKQYIGLSRPALANAGGTTMSLDPLGTKFYCRAWGKGRC
jgi:endonuclease YncB( thermonuclease family)